MNWTLRPTVTLQLYAQPFFASGDYSSFSEFAAPRVVKQLEYGKDIGTRHARRDDGQLHARPRRRDRTGAVVHLRRSELLRPLAARHGGAALGVPARARRCSSSGRSSAPANRQFGDLNFRRDYRSLFGDRPDNVFLVKATYWVGR